MEKIEPNTRSISQPKINTPPTTEEPKDTEPTSGLSNVLNFILANMAGGMLHPDYGKQIYYGEENNPNKMAKGGLVKKPKKKKRRKKGKGLAKRK